MGAQRSERESKIERQPKAQIVKVQVSDSLGHRKSRAARRQEETDKPAPRISSTSVIGDSANRRVSHNLDRGIVEGRCCVKCISYQQTT